MNKQWWWCLFVGNGATCRSLHNIMMGGLGGSTLPLLVCGSFPAAAGGCLPGRVRGRHCRKGFPCAHAVDTTSHSRSIRNSSCDPAMCETRRRAGEGMGGRSWQKHGAVVGFGTTRKTKSFGICCLLMMKHRTWCAVSIRYRCGGAPVGFFSFERWCREAPCRSQGTPSTGKHESERTAAFLFEFEFRF